MLGAIDWAEVDRSHKEDVARTEWRKKGVQRLKQARQRRLEQLRGRASGVADATAAYRLADRGDVPFVHLRGAFVRLDPHRPLRTAQKTRQKADSAERRRALRDDLGSRPPLTRLVHRDTNSLSLYLTAVYMAHLENEPGKAVANLHDNIFKDQTRASWVDLAGLSGPAQEHARRSRLRRALDGLVEADLVRLKPKATQGRYDRWGLLKDDGSASIYQVTGASADRVIPVPAAFFYNGWHLVLDPPEIAMLFAIMEFAPHIGVVPDGRKNGLPGVAFPEKVRWGRYGISGEVYEAAHMLYEFDLIDFWDPMPNRRRGKLSDKRATPGLDSDGTGQRDRQPYHFYPPKTGAFDKDAFEVVAERLELFRTPYRLTEVGQLTSPGELAKIYRASKNANGTS